MNEAVRNTTAGAERRLLLQATVSAGVLAGVATDAPFLGSMAPSRRDMSYWSAFPRIWAAWPGFAPTPRRQTWPRHGAAAFTALATPQSLTWPATLSKMSGRQ